MSNKRGFTLVELLVTIGIIGILATVTVVSVGNARGKARDSKRLADVKQIQTALEFAGNDLGGTYPGIVAGTNIGGMKVCGEGLLVADGDCKGTTVYLNPIPADPTNKAVGNNDYTYKYSAKDAAGAACVNGTSCGSYEITFYLETKTGNLDAGKHTGTNTGIK